jgi:rubrerythrin
MDMDQDMNEDMNGDMDSNMNGDMNGDMDSDMDMDRDMDMDHGMDNGMDMNHNMGYETDMERRMYEGGQMGMGRNMRSWRGTFGRDIMLTNDIEKAITGEVHAYNFYERLAGLAENERDRRTIQEIQRDEAKHYHWFTMILRRMGGEMPEIPRGELPRDFEEGVRAAIRDELEAAEFYQDIAYRADERFIQMHFMHASHDEQRHAALFMNLLMGMRR